MSADNLSKDAEVVHTQWRGIALEITYTTEYFTGMDHIAVRSEDSVRLPITETGYRSHFLRSEDLAPYADAHDFVLAWLDHSAQSDAWEQYENERKQLSLF